MNKGVIVVSIAALVIVLFLLLHEPKTPDAHTPDINADWVTRYFTIKFEGGQHQFEVPEHNTESVYLRTQPALGYRVLNDGEIVEIFFNGADGLLKSIYANFITKQFQTEYQPILTLPNHG